MKKTTLTTLAVTIAVGGLGLSTAANAMPRGGNEKPTFEQLDTNGDGFVELGELTAQMAERGEGREMGDRQRGPRGGHGERGGHGPQGDRPEISDELKASQMSERIGMAAKHMIERLDANGDGKISADEMPAGKGAGMFERVDADGDGQISAEEWEAAKENRGQGRRNN